MNYQLKTFCRLGLMPTSIALILLLFYNDVNGQNDCTGFDVNEELIAFYPFENNADEDLGTGNNGAIYGATITSDHEDISNSAYYFDGTDDYIHVGDHFDLGDSDFTISCWVNVHEFKDLIPGTNSRGGWIVNKGVTIFGSPRRAGYALDARKLDGENYFYFFVGDQSDNLYNVNHSGYEENAWYNLMGIKEENQISLYVDNNLVATSDFSGTVNVNTNIPLVFGSIDKLGNDIPGTTFFHGVIDNVRIYTRALNEEERSCLIDECIAPIVDIGDDQFDCQSGLTLDASNSNGDYLWSDGSTNSSLHVTENGEYWVMVSNDCGVATDTVTVDSYAPSIDLGPSRTVCDTSTLILQPDFTNFTTYMWQDGSDNPTFEVSESGTYWVEVSNHCGSTVDSIELFFPNFDNLEIPNVFTPNGDDFNETFTLDERLLGSSIKVFQRTGENGLRVFELPE